MNKSVLVLGLASMGVVALVGCSNGGGGTSSVPSTTSETTSQTTSEPATTSVTSEASSEAWYEISERAMQSFLDKIQAGGYTIIGDKTNGLTTCVHDENMVTWFFKDESPYYDHVCVTVDGESYYAIIDDEKQELVEMQFLDKKPALEVSESQLPNHWVSKAVSGGNIWTLFHNNNQDNPLQFRGTPSTAFNDTIAAMCDFANLVGPTIQDITLEFDNEDVNKADLKFTYIPGGTQKRIDGSLSIVFGQEVRQSDLVLAWVANPARPYPSPVGGHSDWPLEYKTAISSTYEANMPRAADPMPYDNFFSYATNFNSRTLIYDGYVQIHDFHADEEDAKQYMNTLLENGYQAAIGASGTVFRSPVLRERNGYKLYADITLTLDDGLIIRSTPYYTSTTYGNRDEVNAHITEASIKFPVLPASENIVSYTGIDQQFHMYESVAGFYDYNLYMHVYLKYKNSDQMDIYLADYFDGLVKLGYIHNPSDGTYTKSDLESRSVVKVYDNSNGVADLVFYNQKHVDPDEAIAAINAAGFPDFETSIQKASIESIMDIKGYFKFIDNLDFEHYYSISTTLESNAKVLEVAGAYGDALVAAGFTRKSDSDRTARYEKGDGLRCLMDYDAHKGEGTYFNIWFVF